MAKAIKDHPDEPAYRDLLQHYAIPGKLRCVQCHMGSPTQDFVLGFIPLQVKRRATGTGGTYDATGADELTQLQRLIDVGVITGITSPDDIKPLEESQGARKPRKTASAEGDEMTADGELKAQAYMLGNCAHCHNPRGFPSITKPELADKLNFLPNGKDGGIFEFPFERYSPIRRAGANGQVPIPYITPSLRDYPVATADGQTRIDTGDEPRPGQRHLHAEVLSRATGRTCADTSFEPEFRSYCGDRTSGPPIVAAPWRSLIYRNVDTPTAVLRRLRSLPAHADEHGGLRLPRPADHGRLDGGLAERAQTGPARNAGGRDGAIRRRAAGGAQAPPPVVGSLKTGYDDNPQPYVEVPPDSPLYAQALKDARARMVEYHQSVRYPYCQDVISPDIFDPFVPVVAPEYPYHPNPYQYQLTNILEEPAARSDASGPISPAPHRRSVPRALDQLRPDRTAAALGPQADGLERDSRRWHDSTPAFRSG